MAYQPIPTKSEDQASANGDQGVPILGVRQDTDISPVSADGDYHKLLFNNVGRLKVASMPGDYAATTGNITANGQSVTCDVGKASNVMLYCTGTFSAINCTFEGSIDGGTSWFGVQAVRSNANTVETTTGSLSAAPAYAWEMSVNALTHVRVRATAFTSGTQAWRILPGAYATEPIPAVQAHAVTQSGAWAISASATATGVSYTRTTAQTGTLTSHKATAARLYSYYVVNPGATEAFLQFYNTTTVTAGTTTPILSVWVPAGGAADNIFDVPITFSTALTSLATTTLTGGTAPSTGLIAHVGWI